MTRTTTPTPGELEQGDEITVRYQEISSGADQIAFGTVGNVTTDGVIRIVTLDEDIRSYPDGRLNRQSVCGDVAREHTITR